MNNFNNIIFKVSTLKELSTLRKFLEKLYNYNLFTYQDKFKFSNTYGLTYDIDDPETFRKAIKACYRYYGIYNKIEITLDEIAEWKNINKNSIVIVN